MEIINLGWTVELVHETHETTTEYRWVDGNADSSRVAVNANFRLALTLPDNLHSDKAERHLNHLSDTVDLLTVVNTQSIKTSNVGRNHIVVRCVLLQHEPHHLNVVSSMTPVALRVQVAERNLR